ncbi:MAG: LPS export ABC transporter permease LptG [Gammaproteobacteria bacterium]|nr:LPS export ABC transporter permease LptG [Gammaproteobacteria bacterium]
MGGMRYFTLLDWYLNRAILGSVALVMAVLLGLFTLFELIAQLDNLGPGDYDAPAALVYVALRIPRLCYELFPSAAMIGVLLGLSSLARTGELAVIRFAGRSRLGLLGSVMKGGSLLIIAVIVLGEFVAPPLDMRADQYRSTKRVGRISLGTLTGIWVRDGTTYINIRGVMTAESLRDVYIYEFDHDEHLRSSTYAAEADYDNGGWRLSNVVQTRLDGARAQRVAFREAGWQSLVDPALVDVLTAASEQLSIKSLQRYIAYLKSNGLRTETYEYALWLKLMYPVATAVMILLGVPMVLGRLTRTVAMGQGVLQGTLIGVSFHLVNQTIGHLAVVAEVAPMVSAAVPTLVVLVIGLYLLNRVR